MIKVPFEIVSALVFKAGMAFGVSKACQPLLEEFYNEDKESTIDTYKRFIKESKEENIGFYKQLKRLPILESHYARIAIALLNEGFQDRNDPKLEKLMKRGYRELHGYYTNTKEPTIKGYLEKTAKGKTVKRNLDMAHLDHSLSVMMFYNLKKEKMRINREDFKGYIEHILRKSTVPTILDKMQEELRTDGGGTKALIDGYTDLLNRMKLNGAYGDTVSNILDKMKVKMESDKLKDLKNRAKLIGPLSIDSALEIMKESVESKLELLLQADDEGEFERLIAIYYNVMESYGFDREGLNSTEITKADLENLTKIMSIMFNVSDELTEGQKEAIFIASLFFMGVSKEYGKIRDLVTGGFTFFEQDIVEFDAREKLEHVRTEETEKYKAEIAKLKEELALEKEQSRKFKAQEKYIRNKDSEVKKLQQELDKEKEKEKELKMLREFFFNKTKETGEVNGIEVSFEDKVEQLKGLDAVFIGGHNNLHVKLKEYLPDITIVNPNTGTTRNLSYLVNKEVVFFYADSNNHIVYNKVMHEIRRSNCQLTYVEAFTNIQKVVDDLYEKSLDLGILVRK